MDLAREPIPETETPPPVSRKKRGLSLLTVIVIGLPLLAIVIVVFISRTRNDSGAGQLAELETRIKRLEQKLITIEAIEVRLAQFEEKWKDPAIVLKNRVDRPEEAMSPVKDLKGEKAKDVQRVSAVASQKSTDLPKASDKQESRAGPPYHQVREGETLYRISRIYGLSVDELLRLNHLATGAAIRPGQKLLVGNPEGR